MAIVCDNCKIENVVNNGDLCKSCIDLEKDSKIDRSYLEKIYFPNDLFQKFQQLHNEVELGKGQSKRAISKFLNVLKTSFIHPFSGKEINDPTPCVIIPQEKTLDRIQKILNHNLAVYARNNDLDTPDDLEDWSVSDMYSDEWEQSLLQYVDNVRIMDEDEPRVEVPPAPKDPGEPVSD